MAYMSEEGYKKLMAELKELETVERPKISAAIAEARDKGDSESEANLKEGKISVSTPIAQGLLGKKVGDVAEIQVPQGKISLEVVNISF